MDIDIVCFAENHSTESSWTIPFQEAVDAIHAAGGGTLRFPAGRFVTGPVQLKSRVRLDLHVGATIVASADETEYSGQKRTVHYGLSWISAEGAESVEISGAGCFDGNAFSILQHKDHMLIPPGWDDYAFRCYGLKFIGCANVTVTGVRIINTSFWALHLCDSRNVLIQGITISNPVEDFCDQDPPQEKPNHVYHIINADGIDINSCQDVRISDCNIRTSDDAICIKTTASSALRLARNIVVTNCVLATNESALKLGSESHGRFEDIVFSNCTINHSGAAIACWLADGGSVERWIVSNIAINLKPRVGGNVIYVRVFPRSETGGLPGRMRQVLFQGIRASAPSAIYIAGYEDCIEELELKDVALDIHGIYWFRTYDGALLKPVVHQNPPYPMPMWDQKRAPFDIYCRNIKVLRISNLRLHWLAPEEPLWGSMLRCLHVEKLELTQIEGRASLNSGKADFQLEDIGYVALRNCESLPGSQRVLDLKDVRKMICCGNDFSASDSFGIERPPAWEAVNELPVV